MANEIDQVDIKDEDTKEEDFTSEELDSDATDWKAKAAELKGIAKRRATQLRKLKELAAVATKLAETQKPPNPANPDKKEPAELDYSQKAFLIAKGIEEFDLVTEEAKKFGGSLKDIKLEDLIANPYFKSRLDTVRTERANLAAVDTKVDRSGKPAGQNTAAYWLAKLKPDEQVPANLPTKLKQEIVAARREQGKDSKMFYDS